MKIHILSVLLILGGLILFGGEKTGAESVRVAQFEAYPMAAEHLPEGGAMCQIAKEAFAIFHREIVIGWYPVQRALVMVETGKADMSLGWRKTPEREKVFIFSDEPLADSSIAFFYRKDSAFNWETFDDLKGLRIGDLIGNRSCGEDFLAAENAGIFTVERVATDEQNVKKLLTGRIDAMVGSPLIITPILKTKFSSEESAQIVIHPKPLLEGWFYTIFNPHVSPQIIQEYNDGLQKLRESGRYNQIISGALQQ